MCTGSGVGVGGGEGDDETETSCEIDKPRSIAQAGRQTVVDLICFPLLSFVWLTVLLVICCCGCYFLFSSLVLCTVLSCPSHIVVHELYGSGGSGGGGGGGRGRRSTGEIGGGER